MKFTLTLLGLLTTSNALAIKRQNSCTNPTVRKEWRSISDSEKSAYIDAVKCLKGQPSRLPNTTSETLYDNFGYIHRELDKSSK
jgi:tyrosinase